MPVQGPSSKPVSCLGQKVRVGAELCVLRFQVELSTALEEVKMPGAGLRMESMVGCLGVRGTQRRAALCGVWHWAMGTPSGSGHPVKAVPRTRAAGAYTLQDSKALYLNKQHSKADLKINI